MSNVKAWAALEAGAALTPFSYEMSAPSAEEVQVKIEHCGLCHTDLSFVDNEGGFVPFPLVPGHEIIGTIVALGEVAAKKGLRVGQRVGVGWYRETCEHCGPCLDGAQQLCTTGKPTMLGSYGGYASHVQAHWLWAIPVPEELDAAAAGPLFCAGITVFAPMIDFALKPTDHVGIFGIGGLGPLAVQFAHAFGSEVTAFSSPEKHGELEQLGADHVISGRDSKDWGSLKGKLDLILVTVAVPLEWDKILAMLAPKGRLHIVGIIAEPLPVHVMALLSTQGSVSSSPGGARGLFDKMLRFAARHGISPIVEHFPMSKVNDAIAYVRAGKAKYRVVLDADFG